MKCLCLLQGDSYANFIQTKVQIWWTDTSLVVSIPLVEDAVEIGAGGILSSKGSSDIHDVLLVDHRVQGCWLCLFRHG